MKRFCTECGTEMPEQSKFCAACGHKMWAPDTIRPVEEDAASPVIPLDIEETTSSLTHQPMEKEAEVPPEKTEVSEHEYWMEMPEEMAELPSVIPPELLMMPGFHVFPEGEKVEESQDVDEEDGEGKNVINLAENQHNSVDLADIIQTNTEYYMPIFQDIEEGARGKFNFSAFFFPPIQCLYRNSWKLMWKFTGVQFGTMFAYPLILLLFVVIGTKNPDYMVLLAIGAVSLGVGCALNCFLANLSCGKNFNKAYFEHCVEESKKLHPKRGTSVGNVLIFMGASVGISMLLSFAITMGMFSGILALLTNVADDDFSTGQVGVYKESYGVIDTFCAEYEQLILRVGELNRYNESLEMSDTNANMDSIQQMISLFREFKYLNPPEEIAVNYEILSETCDLKADTMEEQYSLLEEFIASEERNDEQLQRFELMESEMEELSNIMDRVEPGITQFVENHLGRSITDIAPPVEEVTPEPASQLLPSEVLGTYFADLEAMSISVDLMEIGGENYAYLYIYEHDSGVMWNISFNNDSLFPLSKNGDGLYEIEFNDGNGPQRSYAEVGQQSFFIKVNALGEVFVECSYIPQTKMLSIDEWWGGMFKYYEMENSAYDILDYNVHPLEVAHNYGGYLMQNWYATFNAHDVLYPSEIQYIVTCNISYYRDSRAEITYYSDSSRNNLHTASYGLEPVTGYVTFDGLEYMDHYRSSLVS